MSETIANNRRIAKNTLFLYGRMLFSMLVSLYTARVVLNTLGASDFGLFSVVGGVIAVFAVLKALIATGTQRFLTFEMGRGGGVEKLKAVFTTSLTTFLMIGGAIYILGETVGLWFVNTYLDIPAGREFAANVVYQVSIIAMLVSTIQVPYTAAIMSHERMDIYGYVGIGEPVLRLIMVLLLPILPFDKLITYAIMTLVLSGAITFVYVGVCRKLFEECRFVLHLDRPLFKNMIGFTMWNMLESISNMLNQQGLDILINIFFGTTVNASRAVANQVNHAVHGFASNFLVAMFPQITKTYAAKEYTECYNLMIRGAKFAYIILAILIIPLFLNMDYILELWLKEPPLDSSVFCKLVLIAMIVRMVSEPLYTGIQATGSVKKYQIWTSSLTLLNIPICFMIFRLGGAAYMAFWVLILMSVIVVACRVAFIGQLTEFPVKKYIKSIIVDCFAVTIVIYIPLYFLNGFFESSIGSVILMSLLSVILSGILFIFLSASKGERDFIKSIILSKIKIRR